MFRFFKNKTKTSVSVWIGLLRKNKDRLVWVGTIKSTGEMLPEHKQYLPKHDYAIYLPDEISKNLVKTL